MMFSADNTYPECEKCGFCCEINVLCVSQDEAAAIRDYIAENDISPIDYDKQRCCFQTKDRTCMIWEVRPQTCRLHNCHVPRIEILKANPDIVVDDDKGLIDLHEAFFHGDFSDPRFR